MSKTTYERGKTLIYPNIYPILTFTPIFGHRGDFIWIEKVKAAWPEHDSEFSFVRSTMHDERVDRLKAENAKLRELADAVKEFVEDTHCEDCPCRRDCDDNNHVFCNDFSYHAFAAMRELGIEADDD